MFKTCPRCNRKIHSPTITKLDEKNILISLKCGHSFVEKNLDTFDFESFRGKSGKAKDAPLYPYQVESCNFIGKAKGRALLTLQTGLGKTPISLVSVLKLNLYPCLIVTKSSLKIQTLRESLNWLNEPCQLIESPKDKILPSLKFFIISRDIIRRFSDKQLDELPFKCIIIDECQGIANVDSQRTSAIRRLCANKEYVIGLSATPIKNRFDEYFPILSILKPEIFTGYDSFVNRFCYFNTTSSGARKILGCKDIQGFTELTKDFIIHFKREDVLPDLPKIRRDYRYYDLEKEVKQAYDRLVAEFTEFYEGEKTPSYQTDLLAFLGKMRHLTGIAKIKDTVEFVEDFLLSYEGEKITIFTDHIIVAEQIRDYLTRICNDAGYAPPAYLHSGLDSFQRSDVIEQFRTANCRILIASTRAAGEGLNLQFCSHCVFVERQWNPSNEEQAEGRFPRPGNESSHINCTYMIALGTIDEWLTQIIENKRAIVNSALDGTECIYNQSDILTELADKIANSGKKAWKF